MLGHSVVQHVGGWTVLLDPLLIKEKGENLMKGFRNMARLRDQHEKMKGLVYVSAIDTNLMHVAVLRPLAGH